MTSFSALTTLSGKAPAEALGAAMENLTPAPTGVGVFEIEDGSGLWEVGGYFIESPDRAGLALLAAMFGAADFVISEIPETDWVAHVRRELHPVEAGRFFVHGSHDADKVPAGRIALLIEAAMAFGTGHHGTTLGCLLAYDDLLNNGENFTNVADIGCGTAVLAMAAAKTGAENIFASDLDPVAVDVAESNLAANGVGGDVTCLEAAGFDHPELSAAAPYDLVFANILKGPLISLAGDMAAHVKDRGFVILSGILNEQADEVREVYARNGFNIVDSKEIVDWTTLTLRRNIV